MLVGEYYLRGVMEIASGFRLNDDGTFDFFFCYGAADRYAKGTWEQQGKRIILNSPPKPELDFVLQESRSTSSDELLIHITDPNEQVLQFVTARIKTSGGYETARADTRGIVQLPRQPIEEIGLVHSLWSDRPSFFPVSDPTLNWFVFTIDPRIVEVEFRNLTLVDVGDGLLGEHPLLDGNEFQYARQS